jgi:hypothetical protein
MFFVFRNMAVGAAALGLCAGLALPAQAAYDVSLQEVGANVVATGSGSVQTHSLTLLIGPGQDANSIDASFGYIHLNDVTDLANLYSGIYEPGSFGGGGSVFSAL